MDKIIHQSDLETFRKDLISEIVEIFKPQKKEQKLYLKSNEVREALGLSIGKLQYMRNSGKLPYSKIGNVTYYATEDVYRILAETRIDFSKANRFEKKKENNI